MCLPTSDRHFFWFGGGRVGLPTTISQGLWQLRLELGFFASWNSPDFNVSWDRRGWVVGWLGGWVQNDETRAEWIEWLEKIRAWNCQEEMKSLRFWEFWKCSMASSKKLRFQGLFANLSNGNGSKAGTLSNYFCWGRFGFRIFETSPSREHFGSTHQ